MINQWKHLYFARVRDKRKTMGNRTFTMFKPDAVRAGHAGAMLDQITKGGFKVVALKYTRLTKADAEQFYAIC